MIDIVLPDLPERQLDLTPEFSPVRSAGDGVEGPGADEFSPEAEPEDLPELTGRVIFGGPLTTTITEQYLAGDPELASFLAGEAGQASYHLIHAALTLRTGTDDPPFESAQVQVRLTTADGSAAPIAWSIRPLRLADPAEVTNGWRLGPKLELADVGVEVGDISHSRTQTIEEVYVEGDGELSSQPGWLLHRTPRRPLHGSQRLVMVVRMLPKTAGKVSVTVRARIRDRQLLWYRSRDLDPLVITATFR